MWRNFFFNRSGITLLLFALNSLHSSIYACVIISNSYRFPGSLNTWTTLNLHIEDRLLLFADGARPMMPRSCSNLFTRSSKDLWSRAEVTLMESLRQDASGCPLAGTSRRKTLFHFVKLLEYPRAPILFVFVCSRLRIIYAAVML